MADRTPTVERRVNRDQADVICEQIDIDLLTIGLDFRLDDDGEALEELAQSIAELGVLQPLIVRPVDGGFQVVAGRRRLAASRIAGASTGREMC